jgi:hypothetical protein
MPLGLFIVLPEEHKDFSDLLDLFRTGSAAYFLQRRIALVALEAAGAHLDQLMSV